MENGNSELWEAKPPREGSRERQRGVTEPKELPREPRNLLKKCDLVGKIGRDCREGDADHVKVGRLLLRTTRPQRRPRSGFEALKKPGFGADFSGVQFPARVYPSSIACCWEWDRF